MAVVATTAVSVEKVFVDSGVCERHALVFCIYILYFAFYIVIINILFFCILHDYFGNVSIFGPAVQVTLPLGGEHWEFSTLQVNISKQGDIQTFQKTIWYLFYLVSCKTRKHGNMIKMHFKQ